jgi:hypothetical protein
MHAIQTEDKEAQQDAAHRMMQIAKPWTNRRWSELKLPKGKPVLQILKENSHLVDFGWTEDAQAEL